MFGFELYIYYFWKHTFTYVDNRLKYIVFDIVIIYSRCFIIEMIIPIVATWLSHITDNSYVAMIYEVNNYIIIM